MIAFITTISDLIEEDQKDRINSLGKEFVFDALAEYNKLVAKTLRLALQNGVFLDSAALVLFRKTMLAKCLTTRERFVVQSSFLHTVTKNYEEISSILNHEPLTNGLQIVTGPKPEILYLFIAELPQK